MPGITLWNLSPTSHIHWDPCSLFYFDFCFLAWLLGFALCLLGLALKPAEFPSAGGSLCGWEQGGHGSQCFGSLPCTCVCAQLFPFSWVHVPRVIQASMTSSLSPSLLSDFQDLPVRVLASSQVWHTPPQPHPCPRASKDASFSVCPQLPSLLSDFQNLCPGTSPALHSEHKAPGGRVPPW